MSKKIFLFVLLVIFLSNSVLFRNELCAQSNAIFVPIYQEDNSIENLNKVNIELKSQLYKIKKSAFIQEYKAFDFFKYEKE